MICLTFDIEERFHAHLSDPMQPKEWCLHDKIAEMIDSVQAQGKKATYFVVGELAERYPHLIKRMSESGSEVASHSYEHMRFAADNQAQCKNSVTRSKKILEDITGEAVLGFRTPTWTARLDDEWLWDHLIELGFKYDSSLFPFKTHLYGSHKNPIRPTFLKDKLLEIPPTVSDVLGLRVPFGGGFYFRATPLWVTRFLLNNQIKNNRSPLVYFHPWEFVKNEQLNSDVSFKNKFINEYNTGCNWKKFQKLLLAYETQTLWAFYQSHQAGVKA